MDAFEALFEQLAHGPVEVGDRIPPRLLPGPGLRALPAAPVGPAPRRARVKVLIRGYVLPPFFVYGYLLPKFIWFWARHPALWVGMIVLLTLKAFHIRKRFVATHKNIKI